MATGVDNALAATARATARGGCCVRAEGGRTHGVSISPVRRKLLVSVRSLARYISRVKDVRITASIRWLYVEGASFAS